MFKAMVWTFHGVIKQHWKPVATWGHLLCSPSDSEILSQASGTIRWKNCHQFVLFWLSYIFSVCGWFPTSFLYLGFSLYSGTPRGSAFCLMVSINGWLLQDWPCSVWSRWGRIFRPHLPKNSEFPFTQRSQHWGSKWNTWIQKLENPEAWKFLSQVGWDSEQPALVEDIPADWRGTRWPLNVPSNPNGSAIPWILNKLWAATKPLWNQESRQGISHTRQCLGWSQTLWKAPGQFLLCDGLVAIETTRSHFIPQHCCYSLVTPLD